jgi:dUTPase
METPTYKFALRKDLEGEEKIEFLPTRAEPKASGWDVRAAQEDRKPVILKPFEHTKIQLGFRAFCPENYWYELKPRSSSFAKKNLHCLYGTIDETYENELVLAVQYIPFFELESDVDVEYGYYGDSRTTVGIRVVAPDLVINFGDAIGQIVPVKRQEMQAEQITNADYDALCKERGGVRGEGGFGSTGK